MVVKFLDHNNNDDDSLRSKRFLARFVENWDKSKNACYAGYDNDGNENGSNAIGIY